MGLRTVKRKIDYKLRFFWRLVSRAERMPPAFIVVGAQRSGTTSLYKYLCQHPHVLPAFKKEVHFFDAQYAKGTHWYLRHFPLKKTADSLDITGEATPYYLVHPLAAERIREHFPETKIIILLRNPTQRAISHYFYNKRRGLENRPLLQAMQEELAFVQSLGSEQPSLEKFDSLKFRRFSYLHRGHYLEQVRRFRRLFKEEQIKILHSECLFTETLQLVNEIFSFLHVDGLECLDAKPRNVGTKARVDPDVIQMLDEYYRERNRSLFDYLCRQFDW